MAATMLTETWGPADVLSYRQGADLSDSLGCAVKLDSTQGQVVLTDTPATEIVAGVIVITSENSTTGSIVGVLPPGTGHRVRVKVLANSPNISIGDKLAPGTAGKSIQTTTGDDYVTGTAEQAATADNVFIMATNSQTQFSG